MADTRYASVSLGQDSSGRRVVLNKQSLEVIRAVEILAGVDLVVVQGGYRASSSYSAATHAGLGVFDIRSWNLTARQRDRVVLYFRKLGAVAWYRSRAQGFEPHLHVVMDYDRSAHLSAQKQAEDYHNGKNGLANGGRDDGPRLGYFPKYAFLVRHRDWVATRRTIGRTRAAGKGTPRAPRLKGWRLKALGAVSVNGVVYLFTAHGTFYKRDHFKKVTS